jgi:addiction module HigA family antidote
MSAMYNPPHPGAILADTVLRADGGISVTAFAEKLKMTRAAISRVVNGKAGISPELSLRLDEALGTSAESWLAMQSAYDLSQAKKIHRVKAKRIHMEETEAA